MDSQTKFNEKTFRDVIGHLNFLYFGIKRTNFAHYLQNRGQSGQGFFSKIRGIKGL
jgi:hypothetical protein